MLPQTLIVADSGPLIALASCGRLPLLAALFVHIHVPEQVMREAAWVSKPGADAIHTFVRDSGTVQPDRDNAITQDLHRHLDAGEVQAIACAVELDCPVLMDERKGRQMALAHGVPILGVLGILLLAKQTGLIEEITTPIRTMRRMGYLLGDDLIRRVIAAAGETH